MSLRLSVRSIGLDRPPAIAWLGIARNTRYTRKSFTTRAHYSAQALPPKPVPISPTPAVSQQPPSPKKKKSLGPYILGAVSLLFGLGLGQFIRLALIPPEFPAPDTPYDRQLLQQLRQDMNKLEVVQSLAQSAEWTELLLDDPTDSQAIPDPSAGSTTMATSSLAVTLRGFGGFGARRAFAKHATGEVLAVVWAGGGVTGWPGVVHGGAIGMLLEDVMGLGRYVYEQIIHHQPLSKSPPLQPSPKSFGLTYLKPSMANSIFLIRVAPTKPPQRRKTGSGSPLEDTSSLPIAPAPAHDRSPSTGWFSLPFLSRDKDMSRQVHSEWIERETGHEAEFDATLETLEGVVCVRAKGVWVL